MLRQLIIYLRSHPGQIAPFAAKMGVNPQAIYGLIEDNEQLSFEQLNQIALKLKVSLTQFLAETNEKISFHFRSSVSSISQLIVNEKVGFIIDSIHPIVSKYSEPSSIPDRQQSQFSQNAEFAAGVIRSALLNDDYGRPIMDLAALICSKFNIFLIISDMGADGVSAFIDGYAYIVISPRKFAPRMLFTLAHELGHLVLQHHDNGLQIDFSHVGIFNSTFKSTLESFANAFASDVLMPRPMFGRVLLDIKKSNNVPKGLIADLEVLFASQYFGVSFEAAAMRCEQLGLLPSGGAHSMYRAVCKQHKSPELRGNRIGAKRLMLPIFPVAASTNVLFALFRAIEEGEISSSRAAKSLGINLPQLLDLHSQLSNELHN